MKFTNIKVGDIDVNDDRFRISYFVCLQEVIESIKTAGLLNPPVILFRQKRPVIVSGWRRILACRMLSFKTIPVFITEERDDLEAFKLAVYENLSIRKYSAVEKAEILKKIKDFGAKEEEIVRKYLSLLDIPPLLKYLGPYLKIAEFELELKKLVHSKKTDFKTLRLLAEFTPQERTMLQPYIKPLGKNKQKTLVTSIYDLSKKEDKSLAEILCFPEVEKIKENDKLSSIQKAEKLSSLMENKLNPVFYSWNKAFNRVLEELGVSNGIVVTPSAFFEKDNVSLSFSFKNKEEFIEKLADLRKISGSNKFSDLFKFPSDD